MDNLSLKNWLGDMPFELPEVYLVGGTVRDLVMGSAPKDLDLICRGAAEFARRLSDVKGAALVVMEKKPHQPCFRVVDRLDPSGYLDIAEIRGRTVRDDLLERDFTINAMAMRIGRDCRPGEVIDPLGGLDDVQKGTVRMASEKAITADPLRLLRAVRFAAVLGFVIEESTLNDMKLSAHMLSGVSAERTMTELMLILRTPRASAFVGLMDILGILEIIFPEIIPMKGCLQNGYHHKDVWDHSLMVLEKTEHIVNNPDIYFAETAGDINATLSVSDRLPLMKLAALLHDLGKPSTRNVDPGTLKVRFYGHDKEGAAMIGSVAQRLRMSAENTGFLILLVSEHLKILALASKKTKNATVMKWFRKMRDDSIPALILSMADVMSILGPDSSEGYRQNHIDWTTGSIMSYFTETKAQIEAKPFITGSDLIAMGMEPGPEVGRVLGLVREAQDSLTVKSRGEALDLARSLFIRIAPGSP